MKKTALLFSLLMFCLVSFAAQAEESTTVEMVDTSTVYTLDEPDILSWEESANGKYIYFYITDEKGAEFEAITRTHIGETVSIRIKDRITMQSRITEPYENKGQLVLSPESARRDEVLAVLPPGKKDIKLDDAKGLNIEAAPESNPQPNNETEK